MYHTPLSPKSTKFYVYYYHKYVINKALDKRKVTE